MMKTIRSVRGRWLSVASIAPFIATFGAVSGVAHAADGTPVASPSTSAKDAAPTEVTVTARHRKEALQNVPIAISAVSGTELGKQHLDTVSDYAAKVPNFSALQQNPRVSQAAIRGVGGNANNDGAESGVGLIVDNVFLTHVGFSWNDFVDLDGIEVVRGPQGTLLGKNTTVGAVIIKTKLPSFDPSYSFDVTTGSYGEKELRLNATGPVIPDKLAYRLTAATDQGGGWITNQYNGQKFLDRNRSSERLQLLFTPVSDITDRLIVEHQQSREYNNFYPATGDANYNYNLDGSIFKTAADPTGVRAASWTNILESRFGYTPTYYSLDTKTPTNADYNTQQRLVSKVDGASNELNWNLDGLTLTSITAWRKFYFRPSNDGDGTPFSIDRNGYNVDATQYSQEFRLANSLGSPIDWQVGAYFLREDLDSDFIFDFYSDATKYFLSAALPSSILNGVTASKDGRSWTQSRAIFGQFTWHVTDRAAVAIGARYTAEDKSVDVTGSVTGGTALTGALAPYAAYRTAVAASINGTYTALGGVFNISDAKTTDSVSWLVNPSYRLSDNVLVYASASYGEKSGAANTTASPVSTTFTLPLLILPEKSLDYEAGVKSAWLDKRLTLDANLYDDTITNYQATQISPTLSLTSYLSNVGKVGLRGIEGEASYAVTHNLNLSLSGAINDATYLSYDNAPTPIELAAAVGPTLSLTGKQLVGAPKTNIQANYDYQRNLADGYQLFTYGNLVNHSKVSLYNPYSQFGWQKDLTLVNAGIGIRHGNYSLTLWSKNLTDRRYLVAFAPATAASPFAGILGDPRTLGLTLSGRF